MVGEGHSYGPGHRHRGRPGNQHVIKTDNRQRPPGGRPGEPGPGPVLAGVRGSGPMAGCSAANAAAIVTGRPVITRPSSTMSPTLISWFSAASDTTAGTGPYSAESDASAWPLGLALWRCRSTGGGCQVSPECMAGRSGSSARSASRCRAGLAGNAVRRLLAGCGCRHVVLGPCRAFKLCGGGPLRLAAAPRCCDHRVAGCARGRGSACWFAQVRRFCGRCPWLSVRRAAWRPVGTDI